MSIQVNPLLSPRIITIPEADGTEITIQSLINQIRDWEDEQVNLCYPSLLSAAGKETLDATTKVGITATLINAKLKFADRTSPTDCDVYGGNLVAIDVNGYPMNAVQWATNVTVTIAKSSSATMVQYDSIDNIETNVEELQVQLGETQYQIDGLHEKIGEPTSTLFEHITVIESLVNDIKDAHWNKMVLTKVSDTEYLEELYDDAGILVKRTYAITEIGDITTRELV